MKTIDLIEAFGMLDDETVLAAHEKPAKSIKLFHRLPRAALVAAILAVLLSVSALACVIVHANSVRLMEAGPMSGGKHTVEISEAAVQVIENQSITYGQTVTDNGTTVTLESLMGYSTETESLLYLTLTVAPPEGTQLPEDVSEYGFVNEHIAFPFDAPEETPWDIPGRGGSGVAVKNPDGTVSVMLMRFFGGPVEGARMHLTLENFDLCGKAAAQAAFARWEEEKRTGIPAEAPKPLLEGVWEFDLGRLHLPPQQEHMLNKAELEAAGFPYNTLELNPFGGKITRDDDAPSVLDRLRKEFPEELRKLMPDVDWENLSEEEFARMVEEASRLVDAEDARLRVMDMYGWLEPWDYGGPTTFTLEYPDGTSYTVEAPLQIWENVESNGEVAFQILFTAPQPIHDAVAIVINGIRIPL